MYQLPLARALLSSQGMFHYAAIASKGKVTKDSLVQDGRCYQQEKKWVPVASS